MSTSISEIGNIVLKVGCGLLGDTAALRVEPYFST